MISREYRDIISRIAWNVIRRQFPGLKKEELKIAAREIAINIHARMYGANVDGVDSPIWRERQCGDKAMKPAPNQPNVDASELLKRNERKLDD